MFIQRVELQNFRCFQEKTISFSKQFSLLVGNNGTGKTSVLEAINYICYAKSFRTTLLQDLQYNNEGSFFIKTIINNDNHDYTLQVGSVHKKKVLKLDSKQVTSFKQIFDIFQIITITQDDIDLVSGYPALRRSFVDQAVLMLDMDALRVYKQFKIVLQARNQMLSDQYNGWDEESFIIMTEQMHELSETIVSLRKKVILAIETTLQEIITHFFDSVYTVTISYQKSSEVTLGSVKSLLAQEKYLKKSLWGAHLDDVAFYITGRKVKFYASRGQQKLIALLSKLAMVKLLNQNNSNPIILIDDFISDFDEIRLKQMISFFHSYKNQVILTAPIADMALINLFLNSDLDVIQV